MPRGCPHPHLCLSGLRRFQLPARQPALLLCSLLCPLDGPQEGPFSLADPTTLCAITEARGRGEEGSARIALPVPDPDAPHHYQASSVFESKTHRLHGVCWRK